MPRLVVDVAARRAELAGRIVEEGHWLSIDGDEGTIHLGRARQVAERPERNSPKSRNGAPPF
jgi:hypothetical protein